MALDGCFTLEDCVAVVVQGYARDGHERGGLHDLFRKTTPAEMIVTRSDVHFRLEFGLCMQTYLQTHSDAAKRGRIRDSAREIVNGCGSAEGEHETTAVVHVIITSFARALLLPYPA